MTEGVKATVTPVLANADGSPALLLVGTFAVTVDSKTRLAQRAVGLDGFSTEAATAAFQTLAKEAEKLGG